MFKLTEEQQNYYNKLDAILRQSQDVIFDEDELTELLWELVTLDKSEILEIILDPYNTLLKFKYIDLDGTYKYK